MSQEPSRSGSQAAGLGGDPGRRDEPQARMDDEPQARLDTGTNSSARLVGCRLGDYQVLRKLGRGGMADVYAARHLTLGRDVAIKVLRSEFAGDRDYVERFRREARAAAKLNHPQIVQVYDVGSVQDLHFIAQELIDGENLREYLSRVGSVSAEEAIDVLVSVGEALETASESGITHRDIKPENLMRSRKGAIKVADFGLARLGVGTDQSGASLTRAGLTLGTPRYMSPEQVQGRPVDIRSDLYSLGVTLYHLLAGRPPFDADDPLALAVMQLHETPIPLDRARGQDDLPEWLVAVIAKLMRKLPEQRYQSPAELLEAVRSRATDGGGWSEPVGSAAAAVRLQRVSDQRRARRRRRRLRVAGISAGLVAWAALATAVAWRLPAPGVERQLGSTRVPRAETVEEQYLIGLTRNDPPGWRAVSDYFPPSQSATHADYGHKASLQLARWSLKHEQFRDAIDELRSLLAEPRINKLHRVIALLRMCEAAEGAGDQTLLEETRGKLQQAHAALKLESPAALETLRAVVPREQLLKWGLTDVTTSD